MDLSTLETVGSDTNELVVTPENWLHTVVSLLLSKPSHDLECFLKSCDKDLTDEVTQRSQMIMEAIFPYSSLCNAMDTIRVEERRSEALKLFYKVLEAICKAEPDANNLNSLLVNERFHRCLLACSAELVLTTHKIITMMFPAVLERTGVTAFDFSKVIEIFIRHEDSLPTELRHHLNSLEERLIESMVWEKGSSMYNSLIVARPSLASEINRLGLLAEPSLDTMLASINISGGETNAKTEIDILLTKVKKLATVRINGTVERLKLSHQMKKSLYLLFIRLLVQQTSLFFNRHIDQIMLCCFYLVAAKIYRMNLTFKEIIYDYRKQPLRKSNVFRSVFMESNHPEKTARDHVDIITFYNEGFIPVVKPLLPELIPVVVAADNKPEGQWSEMNAFPSTPDTPSFLRSLCMSYSRFSQSFNEGR